MVKHTSLVWKRSKFDSWLGLVFRNRVWYTMNMENDYQRPEGCPEPEGRTAQRSPYPGWLRNHCESNGWLGLTDVRMWKAIAMIHILDREKK